MATQVILRSSQAGAEFTYYVGTEKAPRKVTFKPEGFTEAEVQAKKPDGTLLFKKERRPNENGDFVEKEIPVMIKTQVPSGEWRATVPTLVSYVDEFKRPQIQYDNLAQHLLDSYDYLELVEEVVVPEVQKAAVIQPVRKQKGKKHEKAA